ncbi:Uncharacterized protein APZ42_025409 [Daphnia magna]|uniref:Uncharacterized protein n=1 Tax=Daphnia magna TaxID=35525 RepID=A0A164T4C9_9CRUS|nr:Uncharacterized protein APZ42_025409 [Daphnia magna]
MHIRRMKPDTIGGYIACCDGPACCFIG